MYELNSRRHDLAQRGSYGEKPYPVSSTWLEASAGVIRSIEQRKMSEEDVMLNPHPVDIRRVIERSVDACRRYCGTNAAGNEGPLI